jgi:20S proteasome alpha/beta subunit
MKRDSASGNQIHVIKITKEGYAKVLEEEIKERKTKLGLEN